MVDWIYPIYCIYLLTALLASVSACLDSSPGSTNLQAHWIALAFIVDFLLYFTIFPASTAIRSNVSCTKPFITFIARFDIPIAGWTCFNTLKMYRLNDSVLFFL